MTNAILSNEAVLQLLKDISGLVSSPVRSVENITITNKKVATVRGQIALFIEASRGSHSRITVKYLALAATYEGLLEEALRPRDPLFQEPHEGKHGSTLYSHYPALAAQKLYRFWRHADIRADFYDNGDGTYTVMDLDGKVQATTYEPF